MSLKISLFDAAEHLECPETIVFFLQDALAFGDAGELADALKVVARAPGLPEAVKASLLRQELETVIPSEALTASQRLLKAMGYRVTVQPELAAEAA